MALLTLDRRQLLGLAAMSLAAPVFAGVVGEDAEPLFLSAATDEDGSHWLRGFSLTPGEARLRFAQALPARAHHIAVREELGLFVVVARRPGRWLMLGDLHTGERLAQVDMPQGRCVMGHGVFSADGSRFYTMESAFDEPGDNGRVGVWSLDAQRNFHREAEFASHGIGPHELKLMPDGKTLVVANGGILTHPDKGREKLNLPDMDPSLVYLDANSGELLEQVRMAAEFHQNSIRHLDVNADGLVALVMQYEGLPFEDVPLVALHRRGQELQLPEVPWEVQQGMKQYCGSVRFDNSGRYFAVSCPRGNMITFWDSHSASYMQKVSSRDGCGVCALEDGFLYTAGTGRISYFALGDESPVEYPLSVDELPMWDNHLSMV